MLLRARGWLRSLFRRNDVEREMDDEMRLHLERAAERLMARGMSETAARAEARREFGNVIYIQEEARDARGVRWIEDAVQDIRFGVRALSKTPAFTIATLLSLVLGIGVNTAVFTGLKLAINPGTIDDPATFVSIPGNWSKPAFDYLHAHSSALASLVARSTEIVLLAPASPSDEPRRASIELVTHDFLSALHAPMALGRCLGPEDEQTSTRDPVAVLNYRFWKGRFGGDSSIVGQRFRLASGPTVTVVGVAGRDFTGVRRNGPDFWLPYTVRPNLPAVYQMDPDRGDWWRAINHGWLDVRGRIAPGHTLDEVRGQLDQALRVLAAADSTFAPGRGTESLRISTAGSGIDNTAERLSAGAALAATLIVLLVACFNVGGLMLARAADRRREIAVRLCLGASRSRIVRQLITESAIIAVIGAGAALVISAWTLRSAAASGALWVITNDDPDRLVRLFAPDGWMLAFCLTLSVVSVLAFGLVPALHATRLDLASAAKADSRALGGNAPSRARGGLVIAQVALSLVLLVAAGVLLRSMVRALSLDTGFERSRVLLVAASPRLSGYYSVRAEQFSRDLEQRLAAVPGVERVARGDVPLAQRNQATLVARGAGAGDAVFEGYFASVSPGFFATLGVPIVRGRAFTPDEARSGASVAVVTEATARTVWGREDPIGKTMQIIPRGKAARLAPEAFLASAVVVGVARDAHMVELGYVPPVYAYVASMGGALMVRASGDTRALATAIRGVGGSIDPNVLVSPSPLDELGDAQNTILGVRLAAMFAAGIGGLALVLAAIGVFGLVAYSVSQRTREFGIRMALGARAVDVMALVLRQGLKVVVIGELIGLAGGAVAARLMSALLFGMSALEPIAYGGVVLVVSIVAMIACYIPARRAARVDPLVALKAE